MRSRFALHALQSFCIRHVLNTLLICRITLISLPATLTSRGNIALWGLLGGALVLVLVGALLSTRPQEAEAPAQIEVATTTPEEEKLDEAATATKEDGGAQDAEGETAAPSVSLPPAAAPSPPPESTSSPEQAPELMLQPTSTPSSESEPKPEPEPLIEAITIEADDNDATPDEITVTKGATVELTFAVKAINVRFGGLLFESTEGEKISTGDINPGESTTVTFIAEHDRTFVPFWPSSRIRKGYEVHVFVK